MVLSLANNNFHRFDAVFDTAQDRQS
jgi:hypothetical protein